MHWRAFRTQEGIAEVEELVVQCPGEIKNFKPGTFQKATKSGHCCLSLRSETRNWESRTKNTLHFRRLRRQGVTVFRSRGIRRRVGLKVQEERNCALKTSSSATEMNVLEEENEGLGRLMSRRKTALI